MDKQKAMGKLRYWKMVEIKLVRKRGKSWDNFEICEIYKNWKLDGGQSIVTLSDRETNSIDGIYQEGAGGLLRHSAHFIIFR